MSEPRCARCGMPKNERHSRDYHCIMALGEAVRALQAEQREPQPEGGEVTETRTVRAETDASTAPSTSVATGASAGSNVDAPEQHDEVRFTDEQAYALMQHGVWLQSGGYKWTRGKYRAYGKYPENVRDMQVVTLESVRKVSHGRGWTLADPCVDPPRDSPEPPATERERDELLPCPFCGSEDVAVEEWPEDSERVPWSQVCCHECDATGPLSKATLDVEMWNTRARLRAPQGEPGPWSELIDLANWNAIVEYLAKNGYTVVPSTETVTTTSTSPRFVAAEDGEPDPDRMEAWADWYTVPGQRLNVDVHGRQVAVGGLLRAIAHADRLASAHRYATGDTP